SGPRAPLRRQRARVDELRPGAGPSRRHGHVCAEGRIRRRRPRPIQPACLVARSVLHGEMSDWVPGPRAGALIALGAGLVLIAVARISEGPSPAPLFDGVVNQEPYRFVSPAPNQPGSPTSFHATEPVAGDKSPQFVAATTESPPQAQLVAGPGAFPLLAG